MWTPTTICQLNAFSAEQCFEKYAAEQDLPGLTYPSVNRQGNSARELTFKADTRLLSVLVFNQHISDEEALKIFELLLKVKFEESELAQVNPGRLAETFNFAQKLVFFLPLKLGSMRATFCFQKGLSLNF